MKNTLHDKKTFRKTFSKYTKTLVVALSILGLTSCEQEEEIIAIEQGDLIEEKLTIDTAENLLVGDNGEIIGFMDEDMNKFDINGDPIISNKHDDKREILFFTIYTIENFRSGSNPYNRRTFYGLLNNESHEIKFTLPTFWRNGKIGSVIISPWIKAVFKNRAGTTLKTFTDRNRGYYIHKFENRIGGHDSNIEVHSITVSGSFENNTANAENTVCGWAYGRSKFNINSAIKIPIFYERTITRPELIAFNMVNKISSISINSHGKCRTEEKGIVISANRYDHRVVTQPIVLRRITRDARDIGAFDGNLSSIYPGGNYVQNKALYGMSQSEAQSVYDRASSFDRDAMDTYATGRTDAMLACTRANEICRGIEEAAKGGAYALAFAGCPALGLARGAVGLFQDFRHGDWGNLVFDGIGLGINLFKDVGEMTLTPAWAAASCAASVAAFAVEAETNQVCNIRQRRCENQVFAKYGGGN